WSVIRYMPESDSQFGDDNGVTERIAARASRRLLAACKSEELIFFVSFDCKAVAPTPGTVAHKRIVSARLSEESIVAIAREKRTILKPRTSENAQIPITTIAVQKRISARIAIKGSFWSAAN